MSSGMVATCFAMEGTINVLKSQKYRFSGYTEKYTKNILKSAKLPFIEPQILSILP